MKNTIYNEIGSVIPLTKQNIEEINFALQQGANPQEIINSLKQTEEYQNAIKQIKDTKDRYINV